MHLLPFTIDVLNLRHPLGFSKFVRFLLEFKEVAHVLGDLFGFWPDLGLGCYIGYEVWLTLYGEFD